MPRYRFRSKCPACTNNELITWHHVGCPDSYKEEIDQYGTIFCDCGRSFNLLDGRYNCGSSYHGNRYDSVRHMRLYAIFAYVGTMEEDIPDCFRDELIENLEKRYKNK